MGGTSISIPVIKPITTIVTTPVKLPGVPNTIYVPAKTTATGTAKSKFDVGKLLDSLFTTAGKYFDAQTAQANQTAGTTLYSPAQAGVGIDSTTPVTGGISPLILLGGAGMVGYALLKK